MNVLNASAQAGMHLLLTALGIGPGDEVITPSITWVSTVNLLMLAGATPVFADIDRDTLMVSAEMIEPLIIWWSFLCGLDSTDERKTFT